MDIGFTLANTRGSMSSLAYLKNAAANQEKTRGCHVITNEALSRCSVSREMSRCLFKFEMVLDTIDATQKVPRHTSLT